MAGQPFWTAVRLGAVPRDMDVPSQPPASSTKRQDSRFGQPIGWGVAPRDRSPESISPDYAPMLGATRNSKPSPKKRGFFYAHPESDKMAGQPFWTAAGWAKPEGHGCPESLNGSPSAQPHFRHPWRPTYPPNPNGFKNCRFQKNWRSTSLNPASLQTAVQLFSITSTCASIMVLASVSETRK
jgi:hypothetical protein